MKIRRKLLVSVLVALFVFLSVVATVAIVFALSRQSVVTNLDMTYTAKDIYGSVKATYKLGAGQEIDLIPVVNGAETGEDKLTFNGEPVANGSLKFPDETLKMSSGAQSVVIKYTFENTGRRHYIATMSFDSSLDFDNMTVQYSQDGIDYSSNRYAVVVQGVENKNQSVTRDYYIKVSIDNPAENASFNGEFIWKLEDCNDNEASYISLPALEFQGSNGSYSASMSSGGGREGEIVFPEEINGDAVETIVSSTLATTQKAEVNKVYIPKSVTKIEDNAFYGFTSLEEVVFEQNEMAAASSVSSQSVVGLIEIGDYAFYNCTSLREIIIPNTVTTIGIHAFENCRAITYLTIPDSVILIGEQAFRRCVSLTDVVLGQNLATFSEDMFLDCPNSINITLPNGNAAYYLEGNCLIEASSKILVKGSNSSIIPNGVTQIGPNAFLGCAGLEEVEIPASVTYIDSTAFNYCSGLKTLKVNGSNSVYYSYNNKCIIERSTSTLVKGCATTTIPTDGSVTKIGNYAFIGCSDLTSVTIPAVITSIGYAAYSFCSNLTSLSVDSGNTVYHSAGNCIIQTSNGMLVKGCRTSEIPTDGSVQIIDSFAFTQTNGLILYL